MDKVIQTIVMISKFPDGNGGAKKLRTGKYIAQGSHASIAFLTNKMRNSIEYSVSYISPFGYDTKIVKVPEALSEEEQIWVDESFTKVCLCVEDENELMDVYNRAKNEGLTVHLITDAGHTEFNGNPTVTCLAIGPHYKSKIDPVTKDLKLF